VVSITVDDMLKFGLSTNFLAAEVNSWNLWKFLGCFSYDLRTRVGNVSLMAWE